MYYNGKFYAESEFSFSFNNKPDYLRLHNHDSNRPKNVNNCKNKVYCQNLIENSDSAYNFSL